jgi:hypothetical protein
MNKIIFKQEGVSTKIMASLARHILMEVIYANVLRGKHMVNLEVEERLWIKDLTKIQKTLGNNQIRRPKKTHNWHLRIT